MLAWAKMFCLKCFIEYITHTKASNMLNLLEGPQCFHEGFTKI